MPSYRTKAIELRRSLEAFEKVQFIATVIRFLNEDGLSELEFAQRLPHYCFLLIEWRIQGARTVGKRDCEFGDVQILVSKLMDLQHLAMTGNGKEFNELNLSRLLISQHWFQEHPIVWNYEIVRYHHLLLGTHSSGWFADAFHKETGVALTDFFAFSLTLNAYFQRSSGILTYGNLIHLFCPRFSVGYLAKIIRLLGQSFENIEHVLQRFSDNSVGENDHFRETRLMNFPLILSEDRALVVHKTVSSRAIGRKVASILKEVDHQKYREKFTREFEKHVVDLAQTIDGEGYSEAEIETNLRQKNKTSKIVDFYLTKDNLELFIDAKGVEPKDTLKYSADADHVKRAINDTVFKGLAQSCETKESFSWVDNDIADRFVIIVFNEALPFSSGQGLVRAIPDAFNSVVEKYGPVFLPENIFFLAIDELEGMVSLEQKHGIGVWELLKYASTKSASPRTSKYRFRQFFSELSQAKNGEPSSPIGSDEMAELSHTILMGIHKTAEECTSFWKQYGSVEDRTSWFIGNLHLLMRAMANQGS